VDFSEIRRAHSHLYWLMGEFFKEKRFHMLYGNHNVVWRDPQQVARHLFTTRDTITGSEIPLFPGITLHEGLVLHHTPSDRRILVTHGHQGDMMSDTLWPLSRLLVRLLWKPLQILGVNDPTSPAQNFAKRGRVEQRIMAWAEAYHYPIICGHTHRSVFPDAGEPPYYNIGSGVHPRCITGIEINDGQILLIKWWVRPDSEGRLTVTRDLLEGPRAIAAL
ncbi:MAG: serine/threonine protein phosphatase, partial [Anaerolineae bacterium]|nr:serine/threonine protein phosphatase [Anaerolineae bacterium]